MLLNFCLLLAVCWNGVAHAQRGCSRDRMRQCEDTLMRSIQRRINDMSRVDMQSHCASVREDFNCLMKETRCLTSETDRSRNGDALRNALKHIRDGCDGQGASWRDSSCYVGDTMKNCESSYPLGGVQYASYNPETCRKFNLFSDCVREAVRSRCRPEDEAFQGQYLVDSAQDLAWNCGESTSTSDWDRDSDRYRSGGGGGGTGSDRYGNDRYGTDRERDRYGNDRNGDRTYGGDRYDRDRDRNTGYNRNGGSSGSGGDISCCRNERCDRNRMTQCRDSLFKTIDARTSGYQDTSKCRRTRDDFNCLLWQTSNCVSRGERDRDNDLFRKARDYISQNCDTYGRWSENSCYKTSDVTRCEGLLSSTRGGANYEACRSYLSFRDCIQDNLQRRCTKEDDLYQGAYLVDKAQEMSWQCGSDRGSGDRGTGDRGTGDRGTGYSGNFDRRDQYDRPYDRYDSRPSDNYDPPMHLGTDDADCVSRISSETDQCKIQMDTRNRETYTESDYDVRNKITCCAVRNYRNCLSEAARRCSSDRNRLVKSLMAGYRQQLESESCMRIYDYECSAALVLGGTLSSIVTAVACSLVAIVLTRRL